MIHNFEFKAKVENLDELEQRLLTLEPDFVGEDHQIDTYYHVEDGRLKLRQGNIENALIRYHREDAAESKLSKVLLYKHPPSSELKEILISGLGVDVVVDKTRRIYFIDDVKFHFDRVVGLGTFVEVEAIDRTATVPIEHLKSQCDHYAEFFNIASDAFIAKSYSDLVRELVTT